MTFRDLLDLSVANLWRIKLRAFLTIAGVVIAIATLVALLSFAAGNHRYVNEGYQELGLLTRINVFPKSNSPDSTRVKLNRDAIEALSEIPGVKLAYPYVDFKVTATFADTQFVTEARAIPAGAMDSPILSALLRGATFSANDGREAIVTPEFLELIGEDDETAVIGKQLVISMKVASIDSALGYLASNAPREIRRLMRTVRRDSIRNEAYIRNLFQRELSTQARRFFDGLMNRQQIVVDTLIIIAVGGELEKYQIRLAPIVISERTARRLSSAGIRLDDPSDILAALQSGELFQPTQSGNSENYSRVTLDLYPQASVSAAADSARAMGFRVFSFAEEFKEIQKFFVFYYVGMAFLGLIALITASLGIVNTMVMSISERRREIGILKSLGADESAIRLAFLVESGTIGLIGSAIGILTGWLATRVAAFVAKIVMTRLDMPVFDPFTLPMWLVLASLAFGILISLAAGAYPSRRAARVDPVEALRSE